ncbi:hypothetical protein FA13DRAFT_1231319 [Coprinellus micaceus]|uniref:Uncharacterized protein n=1 Tax=Coprinellus micaceus TaxID=71717 RepID=A0A4Y7TPN1_COPMI|nr:hypothetical protein FA13DRAFT_1231319 [Coprinellus micaceus]
MSIRSQSRTSSSSPSSTKSGDAQVFRTPKAHVEEEGYVAITPPNDRGKDRATYTNPYHGTGSSSHSEAPSFNRRADFYVVPTTPSSPVARNRFPLPDLKTPNTSNSLQSTSAQSPALPPPLSIEKVASSASTVKAVGPSPLPQTMAALAQKSLQVAPAVPDLKHPSPVKPTVPSFFPPPPPSPGRTKSVPPDHRPNLPISPPNTSGSTPSWNGATSGKTTPSTFSFGAFAPQTRSTPKPMAQAQAPITSFFSKPNINLPSSTTPKFIPPQVGALKATAPTFKPASPAPVAVAGSSLSSAPALAGPGPTPVASHFKPLVNSMRAFHGQGQSTVYRSDLGIHLKKQHPSLYAQAGFGDANKPFKRYMEAAADAGIVLRDGNEYVSLAPQYR